MEARGLKSSICKVEYGASRAEILKGTLSHKISSNYSCSNKVNPESK